MEVAGRNATALAERNPLAVDARIRFEEENHIYFVDGERFKGPSITKLLKESFSGEEFNARIIITRRLASWRANESNKYHRTVQGLTDEDAIEAVQALWTQSNVLGTLLHRALEMHFNDEPLPDDEIEDVLPEFRAAVRFFEKHPEYTPHRTELSLLYETPDGRVVAVGQADLLAKKRTVGPDGTVVNSFALIDFKRVIKSLDPNDRDWGQNGINFMRGVRGNDYNKYSLQQSLYAVMLEQQGIKVSEMHLLKCHPGLKEAEFIQCADFRHEAKLILDAL
tara:strand:+ start:871 stop:1710 length:840 start_codon:yes stop_codon:yes gene_type:complete